MKVKVKEVFRTENAVVTIKSFGLTRMVESEIIVKSSLDKAWKVLTNFQNWKNWNSFIPRVVGVVKPRNKIAIDVFTPGSKPSTFKPTVYSVQTNKQISWGGNAWYAGFKGVHDFYLKKIDDEKIKFTQVEIFKGPVVVFMKKMLPQIALGYFNMNNEFKDYTEKKK